MISISYSVFIDNSKNLVFPTMCDAYVKLEYAKHNMTNKIGIWDISGSFTGQFVIKPYDVNGYGDSTLETEVDKTANGGAGNNSSNKTMPSIAENISNTLKNNHDQKYLPNSQRYNHEMCIFYNNNMGVYLVNTTSHNQNNPAEYKIKFILKIGGTSTTLESPTVFTSRKHHYSDTSKVQSQTTPGGATVQLWNDYHLQFLYDGYKVIGKEAGQPPYVNNANEYNTGWTIKYTPNSTPTTGYEPNARQVALVINDPVGNQPIPTDCLPVGMELFNDKGVTLGTILSHIPKGGIFTHHMIVMNPLPVVHTVPTFTDGSKIYVPVEREPMYIQTTAHIGIGFEQSTKRMSIFYNGVEVATGTHGSVSGNFSFDVSDIYLGQSANLSYPDNRKTQFMGEYNSVLFTDTYMTEFTSLFNTLAPYSDIKLYYDFSEGRDD